MGPMRDFDLPQTSEAYIPLRQANSRVNHESLNDLQGIMGGNQFNQDSGEQEEYIEGPVSGSMRALTETGGFATQSQGGDVSDGEETVKFG